MFNNSLNTANFKVLFICIAILLTGCGKDNIKESPDSLLTSEAIGIINTIIEAYESKDEVLLKDLVVAPLSEDIISSMNFLNAELTFSPRMVKIDPDYVKVNLKWISKWKTKDSNDISGRGVANMIMQRETMRLSGLEGDNPFAIPSTNK